MASAATISSGGRVTVSSGGSVAGTDILTGAQLYVGRISPTVRRAEGNCSVLMYRHNA